MGKRPNLWRNVRDYIRNVAWFSLTPAAGACIAWSEPRHLWLAMLGPALLTVFTAHMYTLVIRHHRNELVASLVRARYGGPDRKPGTTAQAGPADNDATTVRPDERGA